jgi:nitrite reductase (NADH) small subunit
MTMMDRALVDVGAVDDIPVRGSRVVRSPYGDIAVFRTAGGQVFAMRDRCAHKGGPLSQGIVHGELVTCPLHNWVFSLATGEAQGADKGCVKTVPVRIEKGRVLISPQALAPKVGEPVAAR